MICLLTISLQLKANCPEADKYKIAYNKCDVVVSALKNENEILTQNVKDAQDQTSMAVKMAADQNWGVPAEVWVFFGVVVGGFGGYFLGRALK